MALCVVCKNEAEYLVANPSAKDAHYCQPHLPWFINLSRDLGSRVNKAIKEIKEEVKKPVKKKAEAPVTEEAN